MFCIYTRAIVRHSAQIDACLLVQFETLIVHGFQPLHCACPFDLYNVMI